MKRITLFLVSLFVILGQISAEQVSREEAYKKAVNFVTARGLSSSGMKLAKAAQRKSKAKAKANTASNELNADVAYYVFNVPQERGFVIISGDDKTEEVLGYSDKGTFDETAMPDNMKAWLDSYAEQIEMISNGKAYPAKAPAVRDAIQPLLQTQWDQDEPYYDLCPTIAGKKTYAGCVATSMAQIMYYNRWPQGETAAIPAYETWTKKISMPALPPVVFDWDAMPLVASSGEENMAVATLMLYVGQGVNMDYTTDGSGANDHSVLYAAKYYFGYDDVKRINRNHCSLEGWHDIVYGELSKGSPVMYSGRSLDVGHSFVCDGYDGNGLYHINWGWSGHCDGFFRLEVLNPYGGGVGSSEMEGGYSSSQSCIIGFHKPTGTVQEEERCLTIYDFYAEGSTLKCFVLNEYPETLTFDIGWGILDDDGNVSVLLESYEKQSIEFRLGGQISQNFRFLTLKEGTYKIVPISKESVSSNWKSSLPPFSYAELIVKGPATKEIIMHPQKNMEASSIDWASYIIEGVSTPVTVKLKNNGDEFNEQVYLFYAKMNDIDGSIIKLSDVLCVEGAYIESESSDSVTLYPTFPMSGKYNILLSTDEKCNNVIGRSEIEVLSYPEKEENLELLSLTYEQNGDKLTFTATIKNNSDECFINPIFALEYADEVEINNNTNYSKYEYYKVFIEPHSTTTLTYTTDVKMDWSYAVMFIAYKNLTENESVTLGRSEIIHITSTGINEIICDKCKDAPYYTISGMRVDNPTKGIYIRNGKKVIYP